MNIKKKSHRRLRPRPVTILGWLEVLQALGTLLVGLMLTVMGGAILGQTASPIKSLLPVVDDPLAMFVRGLLLLLFSFLILWVSFGLFRLRPGAWLTAMTVQCLILLTDLVNYFRGHTNYLAMAWSIIIVLYLNQEEVRTAFRPRSTEEIADARMSG